ncbi:MAG: isochorismate synthase [Actinomycetota bacterium]|nr:isochorismate synthase [Actinomycetota bacterium]
MTALSSALSTDLTSRTRLVQGPERPLEREVGPEDPLGGFEPDGFAWVRHGAGLSTAGVAARLRVSLDDAPEQVAAVLAGIRSDDPLGLPGTGPIVVGALPFAPGRTAELVVPAVVTGRTRDGQAWVTETGPAIRPPREVVAADGEPSRFSVEPTAGRAEWTAAVELALARIAQGPLEKVVLAREVLVEGDRPFDVAAVVDRLRAVHRSSFTYAFGGFVGASPELLVRRRGDRVISQPMAGTVARGQTVEDDRRLASALASSAKDMDEHRLVVDAIVAALGPVCRSVSAGEGPDVVRLATVSHLATTVTGRILPGADRSALDVARLLHPTPAVGGLPSREALATIAELESFDRGLYAGPVGWQDSRGDGEWAVALRGATIDGSCARLVAGAGIVAGSDPDAEWAETQAKFEPMLQALVRP